MREPGRRLARRLGVDRNPLRRRTDRVEASVTLVVALMLLALGPVVVWRVSAAGYHDAASAAERDRRRQLFEVPAVLLDDSAKYLTGSDGSDAPPAQGPVPARWTAPDGSPRTGAVVPLADARAGATVPITVDARGDAVQPPVSADPVGSAISLGCAAGITLVAVAGGVLALTRTMLNRRRMRDWQHGWLVVERRWSGRR